MDQQGQGYLYPRPPMHIAGHATNFQPPNVRTIMAASSSNASYDTHHLPERHDNSLFYGAVQYNGVHHHHHHHNFYPTFVSPSSAVVLPVNHGASDQLPSSSGYGVVGSSAADEFGRSGNSVTHFVGPCKSKMVYESGVQGHYHHHFNGSAAPISSAPLMNNARHPDGISDPASFSMPPYNTGNGNPPMMPDHHNHIARGTFTGQHFQPSGIWLEQQHLGSSSSGDGGVLSWTTQPPSLPFIYGGNLGVAPMETTNIGIPMHHDAVRSSQTVRHAPSVNHRHQPHLASSSSLSSSSPPVVRPREHSNNLTATSHRSYSNLSRITRNSAHNSLEIGHRHTAGAVPPTGIRIYRPHRGLGSSDVAFRNHQLAQLRYLHADEVAILEIPEYYELGDYVADHHSDMRLDIEDMSYEELLALGERIGNVNTGLSEETIASKLKTVSYLLRDTSVNLEEAHCCIICQDNYKNFEKVGVLDCGHDYHAECLKKWLVIKNVCPICKSEALSTATAVAATDIGL